MVNYTKLIFRCLDVDDCDVVFKWNNDKLVKEMYSGHPFPVSKKATFDWINKVSNPNSDLCLFAIENENKLIGICGLKNINTINKNAELFILLDTDSSGKGLATIVVKKMVDFGFESLNLNRIYLNVQENNVKAIKLYKRCLFNEEGVFKKAVYKNGEYIDVIAMACLKED